MKKWSALLFREALKRLYFGKFVGDSADSLIQRKDDLLKDRGDKVVFGLMYELTGAGVADDADLEGAEAALSFYDFSATVHLRANAVKAQGKMSMRRTAFDIKKAAKDALANWVKNTIDDDTVKALSGVPNDAIKDDDGTRVAAVAPNYKWCGGQTAAGAVSKVANDAALNSTTNYLFGPEVISVIKRKAMLAQPIFRPINVNGKEYYVMFIHPYQAKALKASSSWLSGHYYAAARGEENPIFSGSLGIWDGVILHEYERILTRTGAATQNTEAETFETVTPDYVPNTYTAARALFCGAQAGVHAYAQYPAWYEKEFQYGREPGVATDFVYAAMKTRFNSKDFSVYCVDTNVLADS